MPRPVSYYRRESLQLFHNTHQKRATALEGPRNQAVHLGSRSNAVGVNPDSCNLRRIEHMDALPIPFHALVLSRCPPLSALHPGTVNPPILIMGTLTPPGPDTLAKSGHTSEKTTEFSQGRKQPAILSAVRLPNIRRIYQSLETRDPDRLPERRAEESSRSASAKQEPRNEQQRGQQDDPAPYTRIFRGSLQWPCRHVVTSYALLLMLLLPPPFAATLAT